MTSVRRTLVLLLVATVLALRLVTDFGGGPDKVDPLAGLGVLVGVWIVVFVDRAVVARRRREEQQT